MRALSVRKQAKKNLRCVVVHSFAPRDLEGDVGKAELDAFQKHAYEIFDEYVYPAYGDNAPSRENSMAAHFPWVIRQDTDLERFSSISAVKDALFSELHQALCRRIEELCRPDEDAGDEEEVP